MDTRQAELLRYLRSRRAPPGTRGMPAVLDVDLGCRAGVSRLAAARNILQVGVQGGRGGRGQGRGQGR